MLQLAVPLAIANLLQMTVYAIDVIFVARLGQEALAASSLSISFFMLTTWAFTGLVGAVAPLIAAELGRRRHAVREVRRSVRMGLWLALGLGVLGMSMASFGEPFMRLTGQNPAVAERAGHFLGVLRWAVIPMIASNVLRNFVSALGRPVFATVITAIAIGVNALGNWVLVFGHLGVPAYGVEGSASASVITSVAVLLAYFVAIACDRRLRRYHILGRFWRPEWSRLRELLVLGLPILLIIVAEGGLFSSAAFLMGRIGAAQLAGHAVALQIAALAFQVPMGLGQAATIRVGYHFGAGDRLAIARAGSAGLIVCLIFALFAAVAMVLFPRAIVSAYVDVQSPANATMVAFAMQFLLIAAAFQLFDSVQAVAAGLLRGLQDTRMPMVIALAGYWIPGFGTAALLGLGTPLGGIGVWLGLAVGLVIVAWLLLWRWHWRERLGLLPV